MQIGIDSFASITDKPNTPLERANAIDDLLMRIEVADQQGLNVFGIGEHHRHEFQDSANTVLLGAAASRTKNIILTSAVTVLSAADPVRVYQQHSTLDLISSGRAEIVVGRGSFTEAFPLFGFQMHDYDEIFTEKLDLLLRINQSEKISWSGKFRPVLNNQAIYPRPYKPQLPIWLGVGGTPESFERAGRFGMPLMVAVIGGETQRFKPLIDLYRNAGKKAGFKPEQLKVGLHSLGFVGANYSDTIETYFPGYQKTFNKIGRERGWSPITLGHYADMIGKKGALVVGDPKTVAEKILRHSQALGGIDRFTFQMDNADLSQKQLLESIRLIGQEVIPIVKAGINNK